MVCVALKGGVPLTRLKGWVPKVFLSIQTELEPHNHADRKLNPRCGVRIVFGASRPRCGCTRPHSGYNGKRGSFDCRRDEDSQFRPSNASSPQMPTHVSRLSDDSLIRERVDFRTRGRESPLTIRALRLPWIVGAPFTEPETQKDADGSLIPIGHRGAFCNGSGAGTSPSR